MKKLLESTDSAESGDIGGNSGEVNLALRTAMARVLLATAFSDLVNSSDALAPFSGVFESQGATVVQMDSLEFPCRGMNREHR